MNYKFTILEKINGFILALFIMEPLMAYVTSFMLSNDFNILVRFLFIAGIILITVIFYFREEGIRKNIIEDFLILIGSFFIFILYRIHISYFGKLSYISNISIISIFLYLLLFISAFSIIIIKKKNINIIYNPIFFIFFIFVFLFILNILINGIVDSENSISRIKLFLIFTLIPCVYIMLSINNRSIECSKKYLFYFSQIYFLFIIIEILFFKSTYYFYPWGFVIFSGSSITASIQFGIIFLFILFELKNSKNVSTKKKVFLSFYLMLLIFFMLSFGQRGPIISLVTTLTIFLIIDKNIKSKQLIIISVLLVFSLLIYLNIFQNLGEKCYGINRLVKTVINCNDIDYLTRGRNYIYKAAYEEFKTSPFLGKGIGNIREVSTYAHNSILEILGQLGVIGFIPFICLILYWFYKFFKTEKNKLYQFNFYKYLFLYFFIESMFSHSIFENRMFWEILILNGVIFMQKEVDYNMVFSKKINSNKI
jgi:O-antigen ligase